MIPMGKLVKVSFYIIDLQVMSMFPLSPLPSVSFYAQLVLGHGFSHLPYMRHSLGSRNGSARFTPGSSSPVFLFQLSETAGFAFLQSKSQDAQNVPQVLT